MLSFKILSLLALISLGSSFDQQTLLHTEVSSSALCKWQHPVYVVKQSQLDFIKMEVTSKARPWTDAYSQMPKDSNRLINKWSYTIKGCSHLGRTEELIRRTTSGLWSDKDIMQFESIFWNMYLPVVKNDDNRDSNWDVSFIEDANAYDNAMKLFQQTVPSIVYLESDGNLPHATRGRVQARLH
ncbi:hypothetical protein BGZ57DRAFT_861454 [Hyaloscypha finlandica]|nr:hypothetical protein BGZ57DRAFT_861454 [Hyaloscypha finlandica]